MYNIFNVLLWCFSLYFPCFITMFFVFVNRRPCGRNFFETPPLWLLNLFHPFLNLCLNESHNIVLSLTRSHMVRTISKPYSSYESNKVCNLVLKCTCLHSLHKVTFGFLRFCIFQTLLPCLMRSCCANTGVWASFFPTCMSKIFYSLHIWLPGVDLEIDRKSYAKICYLIIPIHSWLGLPFMQCAKAPKVAVKYFVAIFYKTTVQHIFYTC